MRCILFVFVLFIVSGMLLSETGGELKIRIEKAEIGSVVIVGEGIYRFNEAVNVPSGITITGAGHDKTFLEFNSQNGFVLEDVVDISISDLTIKDAESCGIKLINVSDVNITRIKLSGSLTGMSVLNAERSVITSSVFYRCRTAVSLNNYNYSTLQNCTFYDNYAMGLSVNSSINLTVFNNIFANNAMGVYVSENVKDIILDYNLYFSLVIGKGRDGAITTLESWRSLEGHDYHSYYTNIEFADALNGDFTPVTYQSWRPLLVSEGFSAKIDEDKSEIIDGNENSSVTITSLQMGEGSLLDINGKKFLDTIGAVQGSSKKQMNHTADGEFIVDSSDGYKSAGLYSKSNENVLWLFDLLPLKSGRYEYWIPSHDIQGKPVKSGNYLLKLSEANLYLEYKATLGNNPMEIKNPNSYGNTGSYKAIFGFRGQIVVFNNWTESPAQVRGFNYNLSQEIWNIPGNKDLYGASFDSSRTTTYILKGINNDEYMLQRINFQYAFDQLAPDQYGINISREKVGLINGICSVYTPEYRQIVYLAAPENNKLYNAFDLEESIDISAPKSPVGDMVRRLIWLISEDKYIIAIDLSGKEVLRIAPGFELCSLSIRGNYMAVSSIELGQVVLYDIININSPLEIGRIGIGDGPYGKVEFDRFEFQNPDGFARYNGVGNIDINSDGSLLVNDNRGIKLFRPNGETYQLSGVWSGAIDVGPSKDDEIEIIDLLYNVSMLYNEKTDESYMGYYYEKPNIEGFHTSNITQQFEIDGVRYAYHRGNRYLADTLESGAIILMKYDEGFGTPVYALTSFDGDWYERSELLSGDLNNITEWKLIKKSNNETIKAFIPESLTPTFTPDIMAAYYDTSYELKSVGFKDDRPLFDFDNIKIYKKIVGKDGSNSVVSPYDLETVEESRMGLGRYTAVYPDGTLTGTPLLLSGVHGLSNWSGTEVAGYFPDTTLKWWRSMPRVGTSLAVKILDDLGYSAGVTTQQFQVYNNDGLLIGIIGTPGDIFWHGRWIDNSYQFNVARSESGRHYVAIGNFNENAVWLCEVVGVQDVKTKEYSVDINASLAEENEQTKPNKELLYKEPKISGMQVTVKKLNKPIIFDGLGSMKEWREAILSPQIFLTPEFIGHSAGQKIGNVTDISGLLRLGYNIESDVPYLYGQLIVFDNIIAHHQSAERAYQQDTLELAINSYVSGVKFNITKTSDKGDIILREGWWTDSFVLDNEQAPRLITTLNDASSVGERALLEEIYGINMRNCRVIITEFKIPINSEVFIGRENELPKVLSGETFRIGVALDDNDMPGADVQKMIVWPLTYGTFAQKDASALAVFE